MAFYLLILGNLCASLTMSSVNVPLKFELKGSHISLTKARCSLENVFSLNINIYYLYIIHLSIIHRKLELSNHFLGMHKI